MGKTTTKTAVEEVVESNAVGTVENVNEEENAGMQRGAGEGPI